jgi:hypothetical protein
MAASLALFRLDGDDDRPVIGSSRITDDRVLGDEGAVDHHVIDVDRERRTTSTMTPIREDATWSTR